MASSFLLFVVGTFVIFSCARLSLAQSPPSGGCFASHLVTAGVPQTRAVVYEKKFHQFHVQPKDLFDSRELLLVVLGVNVLSDRRLINDCFRTTPVGNHAKQCKAWQQCTGHGSCVSTKVAGYQCQCDAGFHGT